jgi:hypothetical protein
MRTLQLSLAILLIGAPLVAQDQAVDSKAAASAKAFRSGGFVFTAIHPANLPGDGLPTLDALFGAPPHIQAGAPVEKPSIAKSDFNGRGHDFFDGVSSAAEMDLFPEDAWDLKENEVPPLGGQQSPAQGPPARPKAISYSNAYYTRLKIHKYASFAMLPLFISQSIVGEKLYNGTATGSTRSVHSALAAGVVVLFGVNTITGVWNLWEARKDPNGRTKRMLHGLLMLTSDAGFVATGALAHGNRRGTGTVPTSSNATHRDVAFGSMGVATIGYLIMLFGR